ncbi:conserved hypothetical protein [Paraburkholderia piptadeniae]|uniref:Alpha-L-glutamate ligase-related protein ATP-grasp domain-containing protein n=1 Tax=Paraburkholderia piptadeniae TaxID=1701573 RepID=A0A1N7S0M9_9BURK|nr:sugar-transfer associated ATP-grasp domain-containing protein [Paraburkholderia piptadeniae]SIT40932.1 conserved hypothetical protein [Paraburkholderia piptadeniae]
MPVDFEQLAKASVKKLAKYKFHRDHAIQAREILRTIEKLHGKISPTVVRQTDSYARDVFGDAIYAPWLRVYAAVNGSFKEGWIPDNYYGAVVVPRTKGWYGKISTLKSASQLIFRDKAFPDLGYFANGFFYTMENAVISDQDLLGILFRETDKIAFKLDQSGQGKGVFVIDRQSFDPQSIRSSGNGVFQAFIRQHEVFNLFTRGPVATLRLTTVVEPAGGISLRACFLRLGRAGETHVQTGSEVNIPINALTGELDPRGYLSDWTDVRAHPDTKIEFQGVRIPAFSECVAKVLELHAKVPFVCCIGWDVTVDTNENVKVLEWNAEHNDIKFGEATQGPCFSDLGWEHLQFAHFRG